MFKIATTTTVILFMHYPVLLLQPSASPFDHEVPLSPVAHAFFQKIQPLALVL